MEGFLTIAHVVGARPEFIQMTPVVRALQKVGHTALIIHTGQHYDYPMSDVFFRDLQIPTPNYHLGVGSTTHGRQTGAMMARLEGVFEKTRPDWVMVYGDTNSALAGALAATKMHIPIAHSESGERSYVKTMPEEINRLLVDHTSDLLFCISNNAVKQLEREGIVNEVHLTGDVMLDVLGQTCELALKRSSILDRLSLMPKSYLLSTIHRAANTDDPIRLAGIVKGFENLNELIILPLHPRTRKAMEQYELSFGSNVRIIEPIGYLDMLTLEQHAQMILTDSGGVLREAFYFRVPCLTLRDEIELIELVQSGWNILVGADPERIVNAYHEFETPTEHPPLLGDGKASERMVELLSITPSIYGQTYYQSTVERIKQ